MTATVIGQDIAQGERAIGEQLAQLPGFWAFFYERHPKFARLKGPAGPIGWLPASEVFEAIGDTITAYVASPPIPKGAYEAAARAMAVSEGVDPDSKAFRGAPWVLRGDRGWVQPAAEPVEAWELYAHPAAVAVEAAWKVRDTLAQERKSPA